MVVIGPSTQTPASLLRAPVAIDGPVESTFYRLAPAGATRQSPRAFGYTALLPLYTREHKVGCEPAGRTPVNVIIPVVARNNR